MERKECLGAIDGGLPVADMTSEQLREEAEALCGIWAAAQFRIDDLRAELDRRGVSGGTEA